MNLLKTAPRVWIALGSILLGQGVGLAMSTGIPVTFTIDPATIRQGEKDTTPVEATVVLQSPSPTFFICELRSADTGKISFPNIIFKKGDTQEEAKGLVNWKSISKEVRVRILAYSSDAPDRQLSFTVVLKPQAVDLSAPVEPPKP
jgi:hypothetical protein